MLPKDNYTRWWFEKETKSASESVTQFAYQPLISIIMPVYNAPLGVLSQAIGSVTHQTYTNWELCIADDCSTNTSTRLYLKALRNKKIKTVFLEKNHNISGASNHAMTLATGEYIGLLDNDDVLEADALYQIVKRINQTQADLIYSDEDFIDTLDELESPHFKPDFSPDLFLSHNYITHFSVFKKELFDQVGGFRSQFDGAQDYDLLLRISEKAKRIEHIPRILYHWRKSATSSSMSVLAKPYTHDAGKAAVESALQRRSIAAEVLDANIPNYYRVKRKILGQPLVSIVIPFKDKPNLLSICLDSIINKSSYRHYQVIGISNNSEDPATFDLMRRYSAKYARFHFFEHNIPFNFSALVNYGVSKSQGEHVVLMNNDIEVISRSWLEALIEHSQRSEVAVVGAKLYFENNKIQHAGVGVGLGGAAGHFHLKFQRIATGYFNRLNIIQNVSALTGALMMVKRSIYEELGGFDEDLFKIAYNDVDFCIRAYKKGYLNVFTPYCEAYHYESMSRGYDESGEKLERLNKEKAHLRQVHGDLLSQGDPYYNPNFDQNRDDYEIPYKSLA